MQDFHKEKKINQGLKAVVDVG